MSSTFSFSSSALGLLLPPHAVSRCFWQRSSRARNSHQRRSGTLLVEAAGVAPASFVPCCVCARTQTDGFSSPRPLIAMRSSSPQMGRKGDVGRGMYVKRLTSQPRVPPPPQGFVRGCRRLTSLPCRLRTPRLGTRDNLGRVAERVHGVDSPGYSGIFHALLVPRDHLHHVVEGRRMHTQLCYLLALEFAISCLHGPLRQQRRRRQEGILSRLHLLSRRQPILPSPFSYTMSSWSSSLR